MELTKLTIDKFTEATASGEPVPGGGSISALCGALSAALAQMVARLTVGKKKYADAETLMLQTIDKVNPIVESLLEAVNLDSNAYDKVFQAYKMPKETDEEKQSRKLAIQEALKTAASVPLNVAKLSSSILSDLKLLLEKGNQNAVTDVYVSALCARTAVLGACANVRINLLSITDEKFVDETIKVVISLEHNALDTDKDLRKAILNKI